MANEPVREFKDITEDAFKEISEASEEETLSKAPEILVKESPENWPSKVPDNEPVNETEVPDIVLVPCMNDSDPEIDGLSILIVL